MWKADDHGKKGKGRINFCALKVCTRSGFATVRPWLYYSIHLLFFFCIFFL